LPANQDQIDIIKSIDNATERLQKYVHKQLIQISTGNAIFITKYIECQKIEINLSDNYRHTVITCLITLSRYFKNKNFKQLTRLNIINYLNSLRKSEEADPTHKWIGTYNLRKKIFLKFFKWLYHPAKEAPKRPVPEVMRDIPSLKRKEQSIYKPDDLWSVDDDRLFLDYCPDKRIQCYHTVARDTSARPSEILKLRVNEINFKVAGDKTYAEVSVSGKTGRRIIPLFNSIPYIKDWLNDHPQPGNPNAFLIPSKNRATFGRKMSELSLNGIYHKYQTKIFPRLLSDENVPLEDKNKIQELLKKPWNPYIRRHTGLTEKSKIIHEHPLRQYAGWSPRSQMNLKYIHYFGNEASESLLQAYGVVTKDQEQTNILHYKQCPSCNEPNKPDSKFCMKCHMVLTYDAYNETIEKEQQRESEIKELKEKLEAVHEEQNQKFNQIMTMIQRNPKLANIKPEVLAVKNPDLH
jgi:integrase/recombinase XerD